MSKYVLIGLTAVLLVLALAFFTGIFSFLLQSAAFLLAMLLAAVKHLFVTGFSLLLKAAGPLLAVALVVWLVMKFR